MYLDSDSALQVTYEFFKTGQNQNKLIGILGTNEWASHLLSLFSFDFVVDDSKSGEIYFNVECISSTNIPPGSIVVNCSMLRTVDAARKIARNGALPVSYYRLLSTLQEAFGIKSLWFWNYNFSQAVKNQVDQYKKLEDLLFDGRSKDVLRSILNFRMSGSIEYMKNFSDRQAVQYFEEFLLPPHQSSTSTFLDVGAYDGQTSLLFSKLFDKYTAIHCFEPSKNNFLSLQKNLTQLRDIYLHNLIVGDVCSDQNKMSGDGSTAYVNSNIPNYNSSPDALGNSVQSITIDSLNFEPRQNYILKVDTEGFEGKILLGAEKFIYKAHPIIAVSVYHKPNDILDIPRQILSIRSDYLIYLDHYTQGFMETVMFFIPKR